MRDFQECLKNYIIHHTENTLDEADFPDKNRLKIYQHNYDNKLTCALKSVYSAIYKLVGEHYFEMLAQKYILRYPSTSPYLQEFGKNFPEFILHYHDLKSWDYFPDVALFEWGIHEIFYSEEGGVFDIDTLKTLTQEKYRALKFKLHPASRLFDFQFPIVSIWQLCKNSQEDRVDLSKGGEKILAIRRNLNIIFENLTEGQYALLLAFKRKLIFEDACNLALQAEPDFNINAYLQYCVLNKIIGWCPDEMESD